MSIVIGLTGGIGAGKSTASLYLQGKGLPVVDADRISRELTGPGARGSEAVARTFGRDYLNCTGAMDRRKMRELVFRDDEARARLETILHPMITEEIERQIKKACADHPVVIFDCPLLTTNSSWRGLVDRILVIDAADDVRVERILKRPGLTEEIARSIISKQPPRKMILDFADDVIVNMGSSDELYGALDHLVSVWTCDAAGRRS